MNSTSAASDAGSPGGGAGLAGAAAGWAAAGFAAAVGAAAGGGGGAGFSADGAAGATGGVGAVSPPAGTEARATGSPGGSLCTRAVGVPIVSTFGAAGVAAAFAADGIAGSTTSSPPFPAGGRGPFFVAAGDT